MRTIHWADLTLLLLALLALWLATAPGAASVGHCNANVSALAHTRGPELGGVSGMARGYRLCPFSTAHPAP